MLFQKWSMPLFYKYVHLVVALAMWVSIASDAACAAALQQALDDYGVVDTDALQAVLEIPETAAGLAWSLCTALQAAPPVMVDACTMTDASAEVGTATKPRQMRDASSTAAFTSHAIKIVVQAGSLRSKDKSCQTKVQSKDAAVGTRAKTKITKDEAAGTRGNHMVDRGVQGEAFSDLKARVMHACQASVAPRLERAVAAAEAAEVRIKTQLKDEIAARHANAERQSRDAAAACADRAAATAERQAAKALHDEVVSLREVAKAVEEERAKAEREIERSRERISVLERAERDLTCELEAAYGEYSREWVSMSYMRARCTCGALPAASSEA